MKQLNIRIIYQLNTCTAIAKPAAHDGANTPPYRLATGTVPCQQTGHQAGWLRR